MTSRPDRIRLLDNPPVRSIRWVGDELGYPEIVDQTRLPGELAQVRIDTARQMWHAIRSLQIRGAPAIGIAAAMGLVAELRSLCEAPLSEYLERLHRAADYLATSRPTAVNLFWALHRMRAVAERDQWGSSRELHRALFREALAIRDEDAELCRRIATHGWSLLPRDGGVLTHCNTGGLATAELGTALGVIVAAWCRGHDIHVFVDETRPLLQGARLTTWELAQWGIPHTLLCDNAAAQLMREGRVQAVIVGADRISASGDTANKIGTYGLAVLARHHSIPFYVAAPYSTFDLNIDSGQQIPIEQRPAEEVTCPRGVRFAPDGTPAYNPAFDVTPAELITAIITDRGVVSPVSADTVRSLVCGGSP